MIKIAGKFDAVRFSENLADDFVRLFNQSLAKGKKIDREKVLKIFGHGDYIGYLVYDKTNPIGFYGTITVDFVYHNDIIRIAQSINTIILPEYRRYNLFFHLAELTSTLAKNENIAFLYGLPNSPDLFHSLLDWTYLGPMKKYSIPVFTLPIAKVFWKFFQFRKVYLLYYNLITKRYKTDNSEFLLLKQKLDNDFHIKRSERYIHYKMELGASVFTLQNTKLITSMDYRMKIGDLEDVSLEKYNQIIKKLKKICFWLGITEICFSVDSNSDWNQLLKDTYVSRDDVQLMYYPLQDSYKLNVAHITMVDYDTF